MGSPKELHRLQLSKPDAASENVSLRSPISSRIWQAEDPTRNSGFDGEDLCMRNFCVSVHGDHELMEGSFCFDTDGDGILEVHKDFSMDSDGTYSFHEGREDQTSSKQEDCNYKSDVNESETLSKRPLEENKNITSVLDGKGMTEKDLTNTENVMDCKGQMLNASSVPEASITLEMNTDIVPRDNTQGEISTDISLQDKEKEIAHEKSELIQVISSLSKETSKETLAEGLTGCKEVTNGELRTKTHTSELMPSNQGGDTQEKQYRSVAISPIVPPDGSTSFTFQTGIRAQQTSSVLSCKVRTEGKERNEKEDLTKVYSFKLTPPNHDGGAETKVQYRSVAVSPIIPPGDTSSFTFQTDHGSQAQEILMGCGANQRTDTRSTNNLPKICSPELNPSNHSDGTEPRKEYKSVAVSPIIPPEGSSFTFHALRTAGEQGAQSADLLPKTYSFELTPPNQDVGTQADTRAECVSVAVSPIIPPDGSSSFIFQSEQLLSRISGHTESENKSSCAKVSQAQNEDVSTQAGTKVQCVSVAISPIVLPGGSSSFTFLTEKTASPATEHNKDKNIKSTDNIPKTYSFELTPPEEEIGTAARVEYKYVAVSPIIPPDEVSFTFQNERKKDSSCTDILAKTYSFELTPPNQDVGTQAENKVECVSVAVSPIVISQGSSSFPFQAEQMAPQHDQTQKQDACSKSALSNTSVELKPQYQDVGIQVDTTVQCASIAVSPMIPLQGSCSFVFHSEGVNQASTVCSHVQEKPPTKDAEMQVSFPVETRSIATDPMTPRGKSPRASYPEVRVKEAKPDHPEPVREVSWDEKGMTWEVYGASMEVEVLGMAIQKHLEKQIEEHGRQKVMTPQNTRGSSIRGASVKSENKRQPGTFHTFFHSVRRPRCCSRAGPAVE